MLKGCKANVVECLKGCDEDCLTCSGIESNCHSCKGNNRLLPTCDCE